MKELFIIVSFPGMPETTYRFDVFPVHVGRSESNDLSICHEAVPRELCAVWLEGDGRTVRVEERPGLKNPLLSGKTRLSGGLSREVANLTVGPCKLLIFAAESVPKRTTRIKPIAVILTLIVVLGAVAISRVDRRTTLPRVIASLPKSPFCDVQKERCDTDTSCATRARLLLTRAREMLQRPNLKRPERIHAAMMLSSAAHLQNRLSPETARRLSQEVSAIEVELTHQYQQDVMALRRALKRRARAQIHQAARRLLEDLEICGGAPAKALAKFVHQTGRKEP